ncbi:probable alpha-aspartyl dipeptidase isoform X2 [Episyrphus balteatus]|uniref:probable alpha-aspartyl dipeptidase isoform X2 n=1 Tax=Episyrphus balteatus TaxID=286459 RepID=UPI002485CD4C|nr:probable alpha-aspartyl dipeptidase isoform X2 [Episyrphus balteatus]
MSILRHQNKYVNRNLCRERSINRIFTMSRRQLLLISSSRVHGFKYLEHSKDQINNLLKKKEVDTVLFVPYALKDHDKYTETVGNALSAWGYKVEGLHTKSNQIDAVKNAQAIFVGGGNTFVLLKTLYEKNLVETIRERVLQNGIPYIGSSAGTNVATRSIHTTNDMPVDYPPTFDALQLVPFNINPHYLETDLETKHKGETRDERINEYIDYHSLPVLGLREGTSLLVDGDKATLMGDRNAKLFKADKEQVEYPPQSDLSFLL